MRKGDQVPNPYFKEDEIIKWNANTHKLVTGSEATDASIKLSALASRFTEEGRHDLANILYIVAIGDQGGFSRYVSEPLVQLYSDMFKVAETVRVLNSVFGGNQNSGPDLFGKAYSAN